MAYTIAEKAIWFRHPGYNPDRAQKLISSSMSRHLSTRNISSKSMHAFLSNLANRQTDRQTNKRGQTHLPPPLSEVIITRTYSYRKQIARQLRKQYVEGTYRPNHPVTLKSRLKVTQGHWKRKY